MKTRTLARLLSCAIAIGVAGGVVQVISAAPAAMENDSKKDSTTEHHKKKKFEPPKKHRKIPICHVDKSGKASMIEVDDDAEASHRAHGDGKPWEQVFWRWLKRHHRFDGKCKEAPEQPVPPTPPPPAPPPPPPPVVLSCACWNTQTQASLITALGNPATPADAFCVNNSSTVSLSSDQGINKLVYAASFGQCILRVDGVDVGSNFMLTGEQATQCMNEAAALVPQLTWCSQ